MAGRFKIRRRVIGKEGIARGGIPSLPVLLGQMSPEKRAEIERRINEKREPEAFDPHSKQPF